jgi:hypothetical protein
MSDMARQTGAEFFLALDKIGVSSLSDEDCCRLLAWLSFERGASEEPIFNLALNRDLQVAQQRVNLYGGKVPNVELIGRINDFRTELEKSKTKPGWYNEIIKKYDLKGRKGL